MAEAFPESFQVGEGEVTARLVGVQFVEFDEDAGFDDVAELVIDARAERFHGRRKVHVSIDQRRNVDAQPLDLPLEDLVVLAEVVFRKEFFVFARKLDLDGMERVTPKYYADLDGNEYAVSDSAMPEFAENNVREGRKVMPMVEMVHDKGPSMRVNAYDQERINYMKANGWRDKLDAEPGLKEILADKQTWDWYKDPENLKTLPEKMLRGGGAALAEGLNKGIATVGNLALTGGEPAHSSEMMALNIYNTFYSRSGAQWKGYGQAKAVIFCIMVILISLIQLKATKSREVQQ